MSCRGSFSGTLFEAPDNTAKDGFVSVEFADDGTLTRFSMRFITQDGSIRDLVNGMLAYVAEIHPEALDSISVVSTASPNTVFPRRLIMNADTAPVIVEYLDEWLATLP